MLGGALQLGRSLAKGVQPGERLAWRGSEPFSDEPPGRGVEGQDGASVPVARKLEPDLRVEALLEVVPREPERRLDSGTPMTGRSLCAAATPGSAADSPAPAMITRSPRIRAFLQ